MTSKFNNLSEEKQTNILNAAIKEFGNNGFDNASTDIIAEAAGIAKGSLFHYFGSKKNLYLFIVERCVTLFTDEILDEAENIESQDFYERMKKIGLIKQTMLIKYPLHSRIIMDAFMNMPVKIKSDLERLYIKYYSSNMKFTEEYLVKYMNVEAFKPSVTKEDVIFVTMTLFDALSKKYTEMYKNRIDDFMNCTEELIKEFDKYTDIIKYGLYK